MVFVSDFKKNRFFFLKDLKKNRFFAQKKIDFGLKESWDFLKKLVLKLLHMSSLLLEKEIDFGKATRNSFSFWG